MIKKLVLLSLAFFLFYGQASWAKHQDPSIRPGHLFNVAAYVDTLTVNTVTPAWTYPKAGIKVLSPGYTIANLNSPTPNGFYLFSVSDTSPVDIKIVGAAGPVNVALCLNGVGSGSSCETVTVKLSKQKYAYVATGFSSLIYKCPGNDDGSLGLCEPTPIVGAPSWIPESITFATVNNARYAYVASWPDGLVYQCGIKLDGSLEQCTALTPNGTVYPFAQGITIATVNGIQYAYVSDNVANVYQCSLNNNGTFNHCDLTPTANTPTWVPVSTTFTTVNGTQYAYVASDEGNVYQCSLNIGGATNGSFNVCAVLIPNSGYPSWLPKAVTFATFNQLYAYVADDNGNVFQCSLNANGSFNLCATTPVLDEPTWNPRAVAFETFNGTQYAYVANFGTNISLPGSIFQCTLNAEGKFTTCIDTPEFGAPNWGNLWWVAFN